MKSLTITVLFILTLSSAHADTICMTSDEGATICIDDEGNEEFVMLID